MFARYLKISMRAKLTSQFVGPSSCFEGTHFWKIALSKTDNQGSRKGVFVETCLKFGRALGPRPHTPSRALPPPALRRWVPHPHLPALGSGTGPRPGRAQAGAGRARATEICQVRAETPLSNPGMRPSFFIPPRPKKTSWLDPYIKDPCGPRDLHIKDPWAKG